jgi:ubiquinone/menaquinone biosynthesis C-methylase UbiE
MGPPLKLREELKQYYNQSHRYIAEMQSHDEGFFRPFLDFVEAQVTAAMGRREGTLLEIGCGGGRATHALATRLPGFACLGLDISAAAVAAARRRFRAANLAYQVGDSLDLPFADASFSVVVARDVIEHLPDVDRALREMVRVLEQGGLVIIKSPHHRSPLFALLDFIRLRHNYPFTRSWLENLPRFCELSVDFARKLRSDTIRFHYRTPDLSDAVRVGYDADATYEVSVIDLIRFFRRHGFTIRNIAASYNPGRLSRLYTRLLPHFASVGLVAQKGMPAAPASRTLPGRRRSAG